MSSLPTIAQVNCVVVGTTGSAGSDPASPLALRSDAPGVLYSLQYVRAFASLSVALYHFKPTFVGYGGPAGLAGLVDAGYAGVDAFFVLSGFLMVWTSRLEEAPAPFLLRRLARLYIGYLPIALALLLYKYFTLGIQHQVHQPIEVWSSLLLLNPNAYTAIIFPAWSLYYELLFYVAFAGILIAGRSGFIFAVLLALTAYAVVGWSGVLGSTQSAALLNPINAEFIIGMALGSIALQGRLSRSQAVLAAPLAICLIAFGCISGQTAWRIVWFGVGFFFLYYVLIYLELNGRMWKLAIGKHLGDSSYAIYLLHIPVIYIMQTTGSFDRLLSVGGWPLLLAMFVATLLAVSSAFHLLIETPLNRAARRAIGQALGRRRAATLPDRPRSEAVQAVVPQAACEAVVAIGSRASADAQTVLDTA
jgi:peptidoglycan/LPS O-acetylase OafA/YrhL